MGTPLAPGPSGSSSSSRCASAVRKMPSLPGGFSRSLGRESAHRCSSACPLACFTAKARSLGSLELRAAVGLTAKIALLLPIDQPAPKNVAGRQRGGSGSCGP